MKNLFYILIFALFAFFLLPVAQTAAAADACRNVARSPEVTVMVTYNRLKYDTSKTNRNLTRMHLRQYGGKIASGRQVHGLAAYDLNTEIMFRVVKNTLENGSTCVYPADIMLNIEIQNPVIYLSKELETGSCIYDIAMRHEQTHQQINIEVLEHYLPILQQRFLAAVRENLSMSSDSDINLTLAKEDFNAKYLAAINPVLEEMQQEINTEQAKLDSIENYDYEAALCR